MKKLLLIIIFLTLSIVSFGQNKVGQEKPSTTITEINVYPNPFNDKTTISFYSSIKSNVVFIVQDLLGNIVTLEDILLEDGKNSIPFYKNKLTSGIYIYTLKTTDKVISKRFVIK